MGWLFGSKKVPKVPLPQGRPLDERTLRFPTPSAAEKVIQPEQFNQAAGFDRSFELPAQPSFPATRESSNLPPAAPKVTPLPGSPNTGEPLFVKVELYRRVLGEIDGVRSKMNDLAVINKHLETSEYNEENNFTKMKQAVKVMHDRLLQVDKILFKG